MSNFATLSGDTGSTYQINALVATLRLDAGGITNSYNRDHCRHLFAVEDRPGAGAGVQAPHKVVDPLGRLGHVNLHVGIQ